MSARELYQQQVTDQLQKFNSQIDRLQAQVIESDILAEEQLRKRIEELTKKMQLRSQLDTKLKQDISELLQQLKQKSESNQLNHLIQLVWLYKVLLSIYFQGLIF